ncbi:MAG: cytidine deaminase [Firmicutes bacterium]|nr:cytidine deaminase [Bacillota bacterium]
MAPEELIRQAMQARERAYAPYSGFKVGAVVLGGTGRLYEGCNVENASYGASLCAERVALGQAIAAGEEDIQAVAVVADTEGICSPCGICRQVLIEFGRNIDVVMANMRGDYKIVRSEDLMPYAFGPKMLNI